MIKRFIIAAILVGLIVGGLAYFNLSFKPAMIQDFMSKMEQPPVTVTAERAVKKKWVESVPSIGTLVAIQGVNVAPEVGGIVRDYLFESGEDVAKGARLVELDTSVEHAELEIERAALAEAKLDYQRHSELVGRGAVSQATLDATVAKRDRAAAAVEKNLARIAQKNITAPFAGRLGLRRVERGQYVSPGQALVWLQSLDPIWIDFPVPEREAGKLKKGATIELTVSAYPGETFKGEIEAFDARVAEETRTLMVRGRMPNPSNKLFPGMFANVSVLEEKPRELVTIPRTAVTYSLYGDSVWVVKEGKPEPERTASVGEVKMPEPKLTAERRFVRLGQSRENEVAIVEGVSDGERVVTSGQLKLQPEASIKIDNSQPLKPQATRPKQ